MASLEFTWEEWIGQIAKYSQKVTFSSTTIDRWSRIDLSLTRVFEQCLEDGSDIHLMDSNNVKVDCSVFDFDFENEQGSLYFKATSTGTNKVYYLLFGKGVVNATQFEADNGCGMFAMYNTDPNVECYVDQSKYHGTFTANGFSSGKKISDGTRYAYQFDGAQNISATLSHLSNMVGNSLTIIKRMKYSGDAYQTFFDCGYQQGFTINTYNKHYAMSLRNVANPDGFATPDNGLVAGNWYNLAMVFNESDDTVKFYINGTKVSEYTGVNGFTVESNTLYTGSTTGSAYYYTGAISHTSLYFEALSESRIAEIFSSLTTPATYTTVENDVVYLVPEAPVITFPENGDRVNDGTYVTWDAVDGAETYEVVFSRDENFTDIITTVTGITETTIGPIGDILNG